MSLVDLIARADERGLVASGLACSDRRDPPPGGDDEVLRPLWSSLADGGADGDAGVNGSPRHGRNWTAPTPPPTPSPACPTGSGSGAETATEAAVSDEDRAAALARRMLATAPGDPCASALRAWATPSGGLEIHLLLDVAADGPLVAA